MAIAHVSAQASTLADAQYHLQYRQSHQMFQQQQYVEARVEQARAEASARSQAFAHFIQQNQVNPAQIDHHINTKLQAAMEEARKESASQVRAVSERQALFQLGMEARFTKLDEALSQTQATIEHHLHDRHTLVNNLNAATDSISHVQLASEEQARQSMAAKINAVETSLAQVGAASDQQMHAQKLMESRLTAALHAVQTASVSASEQRAKKLLGTYFKYHATQTKAAIVAEVTVSASTRGHLNALENSDNLHGKCGQDFGEKTRAAVRRHLAHENQGLNDLEQKLLKAITDSEVRAVQRAHCDAKTLVDELVSRQLEDAAILGITSSAVTSPIASRVIEPPTLTLPATHVQVTEDEECFSDDDEDFQILDAEAISDKAAVEGKSARGNVGPAAAPVRKQLTSNRAAPQQYHQIVLSEQQKVLARALSRGRTLRRSAKSKETVPQNSQSTRKGLSTQECVAKALKLSEKRKAARGGSAYKH